MITRRQLLKRGAAGTAGLMFGGALLDASAFGASSVANTLTPYVDVMPTLADNVIDARGGGAPVNLIAQVIHRRLHRDLPNDTTLFGYTKSDGSGGVSYLGPAILAQSGTAVKVNYTNNLAPNDYLQVFGSLGSSYTQFIDSQGVRTLTHLHGGFVAGLDDGNPFAELDRKPLASYGNGEVQSVTYPMDMGHQWATLSWYHDHYLGDTRMNVVAGLAGGFLIRDEFDTGTNPLFPGPIGVFELPLVVQDRQFNADGSLLYPTAPNGPAGTNGPWIGEYFGDAMMVNGKIWPKLAVNPAVYRFRVLNGCNARILNLKIVAGNTPVPMYVIGTEGGLLPLNPVAAKNLVMTPAERFDVIVDFRGFAGKTILITNTNPPSPVATPAPPLTQVMQINVNPTGGGPTSIPGPGSLKYQPIQNALAALNLGNPPVLSGGSATNLVSRMITLNEVGPGTPAWRLNLNAQPYMDTSFAEPVTWGNVEDWYFVNTTPDTHPMHTHLFTFKVMGRYNFDAAGFVKKYGTPNGVPGSKMDVSTLTPFLKSGLMAPDPTEAGFKETVKANPGQVTVVRAKFDPPSTVLDSFGKPTTQKYVHHCHIVEHEDNDMMERFVVSP